MRLEDKVGIEIKEKKKEEDSEENHENNGMKNTTK